MKLSQKLFERGEKVWPRYLCHPFVTQMAEGTLPIEKFRYYMLQDYLYLKDYVKIFAAIIQKADDFEQIRFLSEQLSNTVGETLRTHIPFMKRLGITEEEIRDARPHIDNSAYRSYAYIAEKTAERFPNALSDERYGSWFAGYVSSEYRQTNAALIDRIDALGAFVSEAESERLCEIFEKCSLFDLRFWDMVYAMGKE